MTHGQLAWCSLFHAATENNLNLDCLSKWQARGLPRRARSLAGQGAHAYYTYTHIYMHACITTVILNVLINPKPPGYPRRCHARCRRRGARATQEAHQPAGHNLQTPDVTARRASDRLMIVNVTFPKQPPLDAAAARGRTPMPRAGRSRPFSFTFPGSMYRNA